MGTNTNPPGQALCDQIASSQKPNEQLNSTQTVAVGQEIKANAHNNDPNDYFIYLFIYLFHQNQLISTIKFVNKNDKVKHELV